MSQLREQLVRHEGLRTKPYIDTVGKMTVGVGRNLTDCGLSMDEINLLLDNDIARAAMDVAQRVPWSRQLDQDCQDVLINMCFNMGIVKLLKFVNFLAALRVGAYEDAAKEMLASKWAEQVGQRAVELSDTIRRKSDAAV